MQLIDKKVATRWENRSLTTKWCPVALRIFCPHCGEKVVFTLRNHGLDKIRDTATASSDCPSCEEVIHIWVLGPGDAKNPEAKTCHEICVHPNPIGRRQPCIPSGHLPEELELAYHEAINAFNAGFWNSSAVACRKTLEGIAHELEPDDNGVLFERLKKIFATNKLLEPLVHLTGVLRAGGNIGAHFDLKKTTTKEMAEAMVDLLDYFLEYTFLLKEKVESLEARVKELKLNG